MPPPTPEHDNESADTANANVQILLTLAGIPDGVEDVHDHSQTSRDAKSCARLKPKPHKEHVSKPTTKRYKGDSPCFAHAPAPRPSRQISLHPPGLMLPAYTTLPPMACDVPTLAEGPHFVPSHRSNDMNATYRDTLYARDYGTYPNRCGRRWTCLAPVPSHSAWSSSPMSIVSGMFATRW